MRSAKLSALFLACSAISATAYAADTPRTGNDVEARVGAILDNMNQSEKINFIRVDDGHMFPPVPRFGIPGTVAYDSSMAVHVDGGNFGAQYPAPVELAATWNINRAKEFGLAIGYETRMSGGQQLLSPVVNLYRTPFNGRAAESFCGEDPFLCSAIAPAATNGIQRQGIQAGAKHLLMNEQEANRQQLDVLVDETTMRELYLPPFESLVKNANIASLMCGFNKVNGEYSCENHHVITDIVKGEWGYQGVVLSDFNSIKHAFQGAWAGTDLDMPSGLQFTEAKLRPLLNSGQLDQSVLDDKVRRNLRALVSYGFDEKVNEAQPLDHPEYGLTAALDIAREGIVLLKNKGADQGAPLLPLDKGAKIAVVGDYAQQPPSSPFGTPYSVNKDSYLSELSALRQLNYSPDNVDFISSMSLNPKRSEWYLPIKCGNKLACPNGVKAEYFNNTEFSGEPTLVRTEQGINLDWNTMTNQTANSTRSLDDLNPTKGAFAARFTGQIKPQVTGPQVFKVRASGAFKLWIDGELVIDNAGHARTQDVPNALEESVKTKRLKAGKMYSFKLEYVRNSERFQADLGGLQGVQLSWASLTPPQSLADYDAVVAVVGNNYETEGEGQDKYFDIPDQQGTMLKKLTKTNPNTIVVMHGGGAMNMQPWARRAGGILHAWYSGQLGGQALAEILYGDVNPSGKLPISLDKKIEFNPSYPSYSDPDNYVGDDAFTSMFYQEGVFTGYRGYDKSKRKPMYPFGFGLSYTDFDFSGLKLSDQQITENGIINATFTVTNTGDRAGYEVAQLYIKPVHPETERPKHELKGFSKVYLEAGESKQVTIPVDARSFAHYEQSTDSWDVDPGRYKIQIGDSSNHLPLKQRVKAAAKISLTTRDSNPLPAPLQKMVQVGEDEAY